MEDPARRRPQRLGPHFAIQGENVIVYLLNHAGAGCRASGQDGVHSGDGAVQGPYQGQTQDRRNLFRSLQREGKAVSNRAGLYSSFQVSEGLDFADDFGRAVIVTGISFPPLKDPKVW